jgi:predicted nuclease of restriction endonuclease-like (RecB) superfamily
VNQKPDEILVNQIRVLLDEARKNVVLTVNKAMVHTYFKIGELIVQHFQKGLSRAEYGKSLLKELSIELTKEFGKGFSVDNLSNMRLFYQVYSKSETLSRNFKMGEFSLSWSHYLKLIRLDSEQERNFYELEAVNGNWSVRELKRQCDSALYERLALSRNKNEVSKLSSEGQIVNKIEDTLKEPYVLEFLGLEKRNSYSESELENAIIDELESFLLELGKGFTFVSRQKPISFDDKNFYIDLVFYNRILKCFILIDLKIGDLKHQDLGQMQMYVNYYDREMKLDDENHTIGLILCKNKSNLLVEYTLPENQNQIFAKKFQTVLPSKQELRKILEKKSSD